MTEVIVSIHPSHTEGTKVIKGECTLIQSGDKIEFHLENDSILELEWGKYTIVVPDKTQPLMA